MSYPVGICYLECYHVCKEICTEVASNFDTIKSAILVNAQLAALKYTLKKQMVICVTSRFNSNLTKNIPIYYYFMACV